ncbi:MAG TPA: hypothetical protein VGJ20_33470 [Xanthobacteraceae bacterium]
MPANHFFVSTFARITAENLADILEEAKAGDHDARCLIDSLLVWNRRHAQQQPQCVCCSAPMAYFGVYLIGCTSSDEILILPACSACASKYDKTDTLVRAATNELRVKGVMLRAYRGAGHA